MNYFYHNNNKAIKVYKKQKFAFRPKTPEILVTVNLFLNKTNGEMFKN